MIRRNWFSRITCLFTGIFLCWHGSAIAQLEEVVVTAQKRSEDVQDVPISITALSGDFMVQSGADTLQDLGGYVPNLSLTQSSQVANNRIIMRGVGSVGNSAIEPSVAVFVDGVYYPRPSSVVGALTDLEMVEVLRGPQGTFFGRNASMGALNIRTAKPTQEFEGLIRASYGSYDAIRTSGYVSGGLTDNAAGRLSFQYSDREGYGDNLFTGGGNSAEVGAWQDMTIRGQLNFAPSDTVDINLSVDYANVDNEGGVIEVLSDSVLPAYAATISRVLSPTGPFNPTGPIPELNSGFDYVINQDHRDTADDDQWGFSASIDWSVGDHTIRSITAYRDWSNKTFESALRLPADLFNRDTTYDADTVSQEFQIISPAGEKLEYIAGFYYYSEDYTIDQNFDLGAQFCNPAVNNIVQGRYATAAIPAFAAAIAPLLGPAAALAPNIAQAILVGAITDGPTLDAAFGLPAGTGAALLAAAPASAPLVGGGAAAFCAAGPADNAVDTEFSQELTSYAFFGQLSYHFTDRLRLTAGLRYTNDDKEGSFVSLIQNAILAPPSLTNPFGLDLRAPENYPALAFEDDELTWMVNLSYYFTDDIMGYGTYSTGYKTGGFNSEGFNSIGIASGQSRIFTSETVDNFELGLKTTLFDNMVVANLAYFNTEISDFQDRQFDGVNFLVQNAGVLTQQGFELDIQARTSEGFYAVMGVSLLDSEFDSFPNATNLPAIVAATQATNNARAAMGLPPIGVPPRNLTSSANHFSPFWQFSIMGEWSGLIPSQDNLGWYFRLEHQYTGSQNVGAETNNNPQTIQDDYNLINARLGIRTMDDKWELAAFVRNAFDEDYCQTMFNQPIGTTLGLVSSGPDRGGMQRCVLGKPRVWGIEAAYRF